MLHAAAGHQLSESAVAEPTLAHAVRQNSGCCRVQLQRRKVGRKSGWELTVIEVGDLLLAGHGGAAAAAGAGATSCWLSQRAGQTRTSAQPRVRRTRHGQPIHSMPGDSERSSPRRCNTALRTHVARAHGKTSSVLLRSVPGTESCVKL